jgi:hypothetical protein
VSEQPSEAGAPPKKGKGLPKKLLGLPTPVVLAGGAGLLALAFIYFRKKSSTAATASGQPCTDANGNAGTTDSNGNCVTNTGTTSSTTDQSGQPCTDQNGNPGITDALGDCVTTGGLSAAAGSGSSGGGGDSGGGTGTVGTTGTTGTTTGTGGATSTTGTTAPATTGDIPAPGGLSLTPYATYADVAWSPNSSVTSWHYQVLPASGTTPVVDATTSGVHVTVSPLKPKTAYRFRVSSETPRGDWTPYHAFTTKAS